MIDYQFVEQEDQYVCEVYEHLIELLTYPTLPIRLKRVRRDLFHLFSVLSFAQEARIYLDDVEMTLRGLETLEGARLYFALHGIDLFFRREKKKSSHDRMNAQSSGSGQSGSDFPIPVSLVPYNPAVSFEEEIGCFMRTMKRGIPRKTNVQARLQSVTRELTEDENRILTGLREALDKAPPNYQKIGVNPKFFAAGGFSMKDLAKSSRFRDAKASYGDFKLVSSLVTSLCLAADPMLILDQFVADRRRTRIHESGQSFPMGFGSRRRPTCEGTYVSVPEHFVKIPSMRYLRHVVRFGPVSLRQEGSPVCYDNRYITLQHRFVRHESHREDFMGSSSQALGGAKVRAVALLVLVYDSDLDSTDLAEVLHSPYTVSYGRDVVFFRPVTHVVGETVLFTLSCIDQDLSPDHFIPGQVDHGLYSERSNVISIAELEHCRFRGTEAVVQLLIGTNIVNRHYFVQDIDGIVLWT
jgi:hypothetical protein